MIIHMYMILYIHKTQHTLSSYNMLSTCTPFLGVHIQVCVTKAGHVWFLLVPHEAVAEVSKIGKYRRGELLQSMVGRANPMMDRQVVMLFGVAVVITSPTTAGCSVV